jgi:putative ABC transport system permease protein
MVGGTAAYISVMNYPIAEGRFYSSQDVERYGKVIALGSEIAQQIFPGESPVGKEVVIERSGTRLLFTVIGVMTNKGQLGLARFDNQIYMPVTTLTRRITGQRSVNSYSVKATSTQQVEDAIQQLSAIMARKLENPEDYNVRAQQDIIETVNQNAATLTFLLGGIAGIALLVGGIGIMNILFVSVVERTREIGIRQALGAKRRDILFQFLTESTLTSVVGGAIGIGLGVLISLVVANLSRWPLIVPSYAIALGVGFSLVVGIIFGVYPAFKASRLNPVEALRYE